jgi:hypothetical protein
VIISGHIKALQTAAQSTRNIDLLKPEEISKDSI